MSKKYNWDENISSAFPEKEKYLLSTRIYMFTMVKMNPSRASVLKKIKLQ